MPNLAVMTMAAVLKSRLLKMATKKMPISLQPIDYASKILHAATLWEYTSIDIKKSQL